MTIGIRGLVVTGIAAAALTLTVSAAGAARPGDAAAAHEPGITTLVSVSSDGQAANSACTDLRLSATAQYAVFACSADNLVPRDTNRASDIFVRDRYAGTTTRVSVSSTGAEADGGSLRPSHAGTWVAFESAATNLVPGDRNGVRDVFAHNLRTGKTKLVSVDHRGRQANRRSWAAAVVDAGPKVVFVTRSRLSRQDTDNGADVYMHSARTGRTRLMTRGPNPFLDGEPRQQISVNGYGTRLGFLTAKPLVAADRNRHLDAYWYNAVTGEYRLVSVNVHGRSAAGRAGATQMMMAPDGKRVVFTSEGDNLVEDDRFPGTDVFVRNVRAGLTRLVSVAADGGPANGPSGAAGTYGGGRFVAFSSLASNLDPGDDPAVEDVFVRDMATGSTTWVSRSTAGTAGNAASTAQGGQGIALGGFSARYVGFGSWATNLIIPGPATVPQLYVRERPEP